MNDITKKYFYKKFITDILELDENRKYSLLFIYIKFKDFLNDSNYKKLFKAYSNIELIKYNNLDKENKLIDYIYKNFALKYRFNDVDKGKVVKNIII